MTAKAVGVALLAAAALFVTAGCGGDGAAGRKEKIASGFTPVGTFVPLAEGLMPVETGFADASGPRLYYEVYGEGDPLLLIAGAGSCHLAWTGVAPVYAQEFKVIVFDARGIGQSSFPQGVEVTAALMADDAAALLDALDVDSAHVYGISMGGYVAQEIALRHPEKVRSLILGSTMAGGANSVPGENWAVTAMVKYKMEGAAASQESQREFLQTLFSPSYLADHYDEAVEAISFCENYPSPSAEAMAAHAAVGALHHNTYDRLPGISAPTLVIGGTNDPLIPAGNSRILAERIPGAELLLFEGASHDYLFERQAEADAAVLDFLRRHS